MIAFLNGRRALAALLCLACLSPAAHAETNAGDTAWVLTSTALVLLMTAPALALFYGGLVQAKNVLSVLSQCVVIACLVSLLWFVVGYSIAFGDGAVANDIWGGLGKAFLNGVTADSQTGTIPESVFFMFQMTFAIITPALIVGAYPERVNFMSALLFSGLWLLIVYAPVAHWIWGGGWLMKQGVRDFAGGLVVHATAGSSALVFAALLGKRRHFPAEPKPPHSPVLVAIGAGLLWVGWYGFNAGSALTAGSAAGSAMLATHLSASAACLVWMAIEWARFGRPGLVGCVTGLIAGLAAITPAAGTVGPTGAVIIGALSAALCFVSVTWIRGKLKVDDSLDVFAVHGVGGIFGTLALPFLAGVGPMASGLGETGLASQLWVQAEGVLAVVGWSSLATFGIFHAIKTLMPVRAKHEHEVEGLDLSTHGERAYHNG